MKITRDDFELLSLIPDYDDFNEACGRIVARYFAANELKDGQYPSSTEDAIAWKVLEDIRKRESTDNG